MIAVVCCMGICCSRHIAFAEWQLSAFILSAFEVDIFVFINSKASAFVLWNPLSRVKFVAQSRQSHELEIVAWPGDYASSEINKSLKNTAKRIRYIEYIATLQQLWTVSNLRQECVSCVLK
jgi:hypothetical protein